MRTTVAIWFLLHVLQAIAKEETLRLAPRSEEARANEFPYQVSIEINGQHTCGGALISRIHVLTAAHCIHNLIEKPWLLRKSIEVTVSVGSAFLGQGSRYPIRRLSEYRDYVGESRTYIVRNDIAVITLQYPVKTSSNVMPLVLPHPNFNPAVGTEVVVSGFGSAYKKGRASPILKQSPMIIVSHEDCNEEFLTKVGKFIVPSIICAEFGKHAGTCQGDSGGPLVYQNGEENIVVGIVSAGVEECGDGTPDTYTRVTSFLPYIEYEMNYDPNNAKKSERGLSSRAVDLVSSTPRTTESPYPIRIPRKSNKFGNFFNDFDNDDPFQGIFSHFGLRSSGQRFPW
ncbi:hypothetical protein QAD02_010316 [Eretmocerus hayati]|uniref:Uncharacterized protein n=1 Tax=Eretmocerus hayati TaxID=131215 RepID=A0ACC2NCI1_9HYME|nr:hypothetical protein QAD02_010316 [Eretmocerus hayati]